MKFIATKEADRYALALVAAPQSGGPSAEQIEQAAWDNAAIADGIVVVQTAAGAEVGRAVESYIQRVNALIGGEHVPAGAWLVGVIFEPEFWPKIDEVAVACGDGSCTIESEIVPKRKGENMPRIRTQKLRVDFAPGRDLVVVLKDGAGARMLARQFRDIVRATYPEDAMPETFVAKRGIAKGAFADQLVASRVGDELPDAMEAFNAAVWSVMTNEELDAAAKTAALKEAVTEFADHLAGMVAVTKRAWEREWEKDDLARPRPVTKKEDEVSWDDLMTRTAYDAK